MKKLALAITSALAMVAAAPVSAAVFDFTYTGETIPGGVAVLTTGQLTTTDTMTTIGGRRAYTITGITGTRNGIAIAALAPVFPTAFGGADNLLFANGTPVSDRGFSFRLVNNSFASIYLDDGDIDDGGIGEYFAINIDGTAGRTNAAGALAFSPAATGAATAAVPEVATWGMMLAGFGMAGTSLRSRRRSTTVTYA